MTERPHGHIKSNGHTAQLVIYTSTAVHRSGKSSVVERRRRLWSKTPTPTLKHENRRKSALERVLSADVVTPGALVLSRQYIIPYETPGRREAAYHIGNQAMLCTKVVSQTI